MSNMVKKQQKNPQNKTTPASPSSLSRSQELQQWLNCPSSAGSGTGTPGRSAAPRWDEPPQQQPGGHSPPGEQTKEATATAPRGDSLPAPGGTEPTEQRWHHGHNSLFRASFHKASGDTVSAACFVKDCIDNSCIFVIFLFISITCSGLILLITLRHIANLHSNLHCRSYTFSLKTKNVVKKVKPKTS